MIWILWALLAHMTSGIVFIVDKALLGSGGAIGKPMRYAVYSGLVASGAVLLLPFAYAAPTMFVLGWSLLAGVLWLAALWLFFIGLKFGDPSRVVPITGSAVPVFTFLLAAVFLGERLDMRDILAVLFLVGGGALLSIRFKGTKGVPVKALLGAVFGGAAFAAHFALAKFIYDRFDPFLAAFAYIRLGVGVAAIGLFVWLWLTSGEKKKVKKTKKTKKRTIAITVAFFGSKGLGVVALLLLNYAISLGSVTVVNALQGVQYAFVLLLAVFVSRQWPKLFKEELQRVTVIQKIAGILLVSIGLILVLGL